MKHYYIKEKYTGLCDGFYPEDTAEAMLNGARKFYPNGDFCLIEAVENLPDEMFYGDIGEKEFKARIEEARAMSEDGNNTDQPSLDGFTRFGTDNFGINDITT